MGQSLRHNFASQKLPKSPSRTPRPALPLNRKERCNPSDCPPSVVYSYSEQAKGHLKGGRVLLHNPGRFWESLASAPAPQVPIFISVGGLGGMHFRTIGTQGPSSSLPDKAGEGCKGLQAAGRTHCPVRPSVVWAMILAMTTINT